MTQETESPDTPGGLRHLRRRKAGCRRRRCGGGRPWSYKTVIDTLLNPVYIGTVHFRDITVEDAHPAIINQVWPRTGWGR